MKVSLRWLRDLAPGLEGDVDEVAARLALRGAPVEGIEDLAAGLRDVVVGQVLDVRPHPNADRLVLCRVLGPDGEAPVVCGAPDVRAGAFYPFAPVGAVLPGGFKIGRRRIRGQESRGMLCSESELGLGDDHAGIMLMEGSHEAGAPFAEAADLDDHRLDVEVTPNRGDLLSHVGVARELHPMGDAGLVLPAFPAAGGADSGPAAGAGASGDALPLRELRAGGAALQGGPDVVVGVPRSSWANVEIEIEEPGLCSRYLGAIVTGVKVGPSPPWLAARLRAAGARPVNNIVDATNYVMLELGQPLHAFDLARLPQGRIAVGRARQGESLVTLDGERRALSPDMLMIRGAHEPVAIAGVMGGRDSEVTDETTELVLECACFEPRQVRATRRALGMSTDASYRFERGVDPSFMEIAVRRAADLVLAVAGGSLAGRIIDARASAEPWRPPVVGLRPSRVRRLLGVPFAPEAITALLEPLGYERAEAGGRGGERGQAASETGAAEADAGQPDAGQQGDGLQAGRADADPDLMHFRVPGHRSYDTLREVDLIEEVARTHGYDAFPATLGPHRPGTVPDHPLFELEDRLRARLVADGLCEAQTPSLGPPAHGDVALLNPMSADESHLRRDRLQGLLGHLERNLARGVRDVRLFEIGTAFAPAPPARQGRAGDAAVQGGRGADDASGGAPAAPVETTRVAVVLHGRRAPLQWASDGAAFDVHDIARVLELIAREAFPGGAVAPARADRPPYRAGASYAVRDRGGRVVGRGGEMDAAGMDLPPWADVVLGAEVVLPSSPEPPVAATAADVPDQPASERDLAFVLPEGAAAGTVLAAARRAGGKLLEEAVLFDVFEGGDLPSGARSVAVRLRFRARGRTLTDREVDRACHKVTAAVRKSTGAQARS